MEYHWEEFSGSVTSAETAATVPRDMEWELSIELGRTEMHLDEMLRLRRGAVVPLDKAAADPVEVYASGRLLARGELLVVEDKLAVRVTELVA